MFGYHGRYLRIDLTRGTADEVPLAEEVLRRFLGGVGLATWLLHREAPPLDRSTATQIVEAMEVGPALMPNFGPAAVDAAGQGDVAAYTQQIARRPDELCSRGSVRRPRCSPARSGSRRGLASWSS